MTKEEAIYTILSQSELNTQVGGRIYPLVAPYQTDKYPFCVYSQMSRRAQGTKDGDECSLILAVSIASKTYKEAHDLALLAQKIFYDDATTTTEETVGFSNFRFESETEMFDLQTNTFMVKVEVSYEYNAIQLWQTAASE